MNVLCTIGIYLAVSIFVSSMLPQEPYSLRVVCVRECDHKFDYLEMKPKRIIYDGVEVDMKLHYLDFNTRFPMLGTYGGRTKWNERNLQLEFGGSVDSHIPVSEANDLNALIDFGYHVEELEVLP